MKNDKHSRYFLLLVALEFSVCFADGEEQKLGVVGPIVGVVESTTAQVMYRPGAGQTSLRLTLLSDGKAVCRVPAESLAENDFVAKFHISELQPATVYTYQIEEDGGQMLVAPDESHSFKTANHSRENSRVSVSFLSCVDIEPSGIWDEMELLDVDMVCLMGDTPYIDSSDLGVVRSQHRTFLQMPDLASLATHTPIVGTWDDHDFGRNNGNGLNMMSSKGKTRRGFVEYRSHTQFGNGTEGVYHKVDLGMMEVFLLDPRYFSQVEPSPVDETQPTCFGADQWKWLLDGLRESQAPFKVLAFGAIWQDKKNTETDDMFTYWYERDALLNFIKSENISGVVLLGGDIHLARHLVHPQRVGYDLHDFIISPGHERVITKLDVFHPSLEWSLVDGHQFLNLTADGTAAEPKLIAEFRQPNGVVNRRVELLLSQVTREPSTEPNLEPRAYWAFDDGFANTSPLGNRIGAEPRNGAEIVDGGVTGSAVEFKREKRQFVNVPRSFLDDNSSAHTVSFWFKPKTLPTHNSRERSFLLESTAEGKPSNKSAWHLSLGLRSTLDAGKVNLQLYTHTVAPASKPQAAPNAISQGPFDTIVERSSLLGRWNHVAVTFDSEHLTLFLNGQQIGRHPLPTRGPASEFGGLVLGGHRAGTGRNFDGLIDEVSIWQRMLTTRELRAIFDRVESH